MLLQSASLIVHAVVCVNLVFTYDQCNLLMTYEVYQTLKQPKQKYAITANLL